MVGYRYCVCVAHDRYIGDMKMVRHCGCAYVRDVAGIFSRHHWTF
jgi:hypothetical protein